MSVCRRRRRGRRTPLPSRDLVGVAIFASLALVFSPSATRGQSLEWSVGALLLLDTEFVDGTEFGPGLSAMVTVAPRRALSYFALVSAARTDFPVVSDELHRNFGAAAVGLRLAPSGEGPRVGLTLGLGFVLWDDVSETDPGFRSSANFEEMLLPGVEAGIPIGASWRLTLSARDQVTGWWHAILEA